MPRLSVLLAVLLLAALRTAGAQPVVPPAAPHYDVVALRVEFQPDTTRFTTGDGTFATPPWGDLQPAIDPLPHDADYFEAHLRFLAHYVETVSDGRTRVTPHLLPEVVRVARPMADYAPVGFDADAPGERAKLAALVRDAWAAASAQSAFDPSALDPATTVFVLFHAGIGRDIELTGTTLDRTPADLPSLFFDADALDALVGAPIAFKGLPVRSTVVLPRSETRRGVDPLSEEPFLLELSTNGLLAASFLNALGVPDLFDTATGATAIGPFGLMDPLGFFAYGGLFAPQPSAWTRTALGWADPVALGGAEQTVSLEAAGRPAGPSVARADVSEREYFLVENRHRDVAGDGLVLQVWRDGAVVEERFEDGDETFNAFIQDGFGGGVVVGVDDYDWALPGGLDENGERLLGGALVWHVDEARIAGGAAGTGVNADRERRGLDLEEADSAQDLGFESVGFGPSSDRGSPFDFFYEGNPVAVETAGGRLVRLYENRFGPSTTPSSATNAGGPSFVVLEAFSPPGPTMTVTYRRAEDPAVTPLPAPPQPLSVATDGAVVAGPDGSALIYTAGPAETPGTILRVDGADVRLVSDRAASAPVWTGGARVALFEQDEDGGAAVQLVEGFERGARLALPDGLAVRSQAAVDGADVVAVADDGGAAVFVRVQGAAEGRIDGVQTSRMEDVGEGAALAVLGDGRVVVAGTRGAAVEEGPTWTFDGLPSESAATAAFGTETEEVVGVLRHGGALRWLLPDGTVEDHPLPEPGPDGPAPLRSGPALVDLDADGRLEALVAEGDRLLALTRSGALLGGFPIRLPSPAASMPLVAEGAGGPVVLVGGADGSVHAVALRGEGVVQDGFPLAAGAAVRVAPLLQDKNLTVVSGTGVVRAWRLEGGVEAGPWSARYAGPGNPNAVAAAPVDAPDPARLIDVRETYNWPNPIREGSTRLRCATTQDADVEITVVDLAGAVVDRLTLVTRAGLPAEVAWSADLPSGVYYARVRATAADGTSETHVVKMAVIR